ncbi:hypothetical protein [Occallatibacter riparius]|uniref:Uncharacterized protein n=1 Tax=Occallatibacter riparius TaxID=1002689 RepID=A0A9J7BMB7_9BACT|nr:hypothetical protein [Occallatibacter riparius]UWZ82054.1 hypothetical protein MOP44_15905 [Occallatibacter riparius]
MTEQTNQVNPVDTDIDDPVLRSALGDFRASLHAWSDAAYNRPRPALSSAPQAIAWRRAIGWVLSLILSFGILGTAAYERHHSQIIAQERQHQQDLERQRLADEQRARESAAATDTEDLMAAVDSAVSRQVPAAMAPLALTADEIQ